MAAIVVSGTAGDDALVGDGDALGDTLRGLAGNDTLQGDAGADVLDGGAGNDILIGGNGADLYAVGSAGDQVIESAGNGTDTVDASVSYTLTAGQSIEFLRAISTSAAATTGALTQTVLTTGVSLIGNNQLNTIIGGNGSDFLDGGVDLNATTAVIDSLQGLLGDDTYVVRGGVDVITEALNEGNDTVLVAPFITVDNTTTFTSYTLTAGSSVENLAAQDAASTVRIDLTGNAGFAQNVSGNAGANVLAGGGANVAGAQGIDTLTGFGGNDTYVLTNSNTILVEADGNGTDVLQINAAAFTNGTTATLVTTYTLAAGVSVETVTLTGATALNFTGNEFNQAITGTTGANSLSGGTGEDTLTGLAGDDTYVVNSAGDVVIEDNAAGGAGFDSIFTNRNYILGATQSIELLAAAGAVTVSTVSDNDGTVSANGLNITNNGNIFLVGNVYDGTGGDVLQGDAGSNILDGNNFNVTTQAVIAGTSTLAGLGGDDTYRVYAQGDIVIEDRAGGFDRIFTSASFDLRDATQVGLYNDATNTGNIQYYTNGQAEIELLSTATNSGNAGVTGFNLSGNGFGQIILGDFGANSISGGYGNGIGSTGGTVFGGVDALYGFRGNDTYLVTSQNTLVFESAGNQEGTNDVINVDSSVVSTFVLNGGSYVETLQALSAASTQALTLVGNELSQTITGNAGANTLSSGAGAPDTLIGLAGDDVYRVFNGEDTIVEAAVGGTDTIFTSGASYQIGVGVEIEYLSASVQGGGENIFLVGNAGFQTIVGNFGANTLDGNAGVSGQRDILQGLNGDDVYRVYVSNIDAAGVSQDNPAAGGASAVLVDALVDYAGDIVIEQFGIGNFDQVFTSANYALRANSEVEYLSASNQAATGNLFLRGNSLAQTIVGNNGTNTIDGRGGNDTLTGLGGSDVFAFTSALNGTTNVDQITDFAPGDFIGLATDIFANVTGGGITAGEFVIGTAALDGDDRLIYNQSTGQLFYDADANGSGAAVLFAQFVPGTALGFNDFVSAGIAPVTADLTAY